MERREFLAVAAGSTLAVGSGCSASGSDDRATGNRRSPETRLRVQSQTDREYDLSFVLRELQSATVVYERTRTVGPGDSFSLGSQFEPGGEYRFVVRQAGSKLLNFSIYPYEGYVVTVRPGPKVEIAREVEI